jgi:acyl-coenzyme A thioesterase PaaI-like protein
MSVCETLQLRKLEADRCFACGQNNPVGLHLVFEYVDGQARATFVPQVEHEGWSGIVHGGILLTLLDEAMAYALYYRGITGVTARFETRFRQAVLVGEVLQVRAHITNERRRLIDTTGTIVRADGVIVAEAVARFMVVEGEEAPAGRGGE